MWYGKVGTALQSVWETSPGHQYRGIGFFQTDTLYIRSITSLYASSTAFRLMFPFVDVRGRVCRGTTTTMFVDVIRSWRYRRAWNCRVLRMISFFSFSASTPTAGSTKRTGEGRPVPTTTHSSIELPQANRTLSSIALNRGPQLAM